ncbi:MAG TPA: alpha/beta hydrolase [Afifellaceae bacterium]|nr:alpha/beta hydrolase [Afifellaceae bacterium]
MIAGFAVFLVTACVVLWLFSRLAVLLLERRFAPIGSVLALPFGQIHIVDLPAARPDAACVVLVHGAAGNLRDLFHALSGHLTGRFRLIVIDRPGHGFSTRRDPLGSDPRRQAKALDAVLTRLGIDRAIVVGQSWGGAFAAAFALRYPRRVQGLVFIAPATHPWPSGINWHTRIGALPVIGRIFAELAAMPVGLVLVPCALRTIFAPNAIPADYRDRIGAALVLRPRSFVANCRDIADFYGHVTTMAAHYDRIDTPTEIITGDTDAIVAPAIHAYGLARDIPGARLTVLPGIGHMPHWAAPEAVVAAIERVAARSVVGETAVRRVAAE